MSTKGGNVENALRTIAYATLFLRIRCLASPVQFINYHTSYCMQGMGFGKATIIHSVFRQLVFYIPLLFILDHFFGERGLACALPVGELCGAIFALWLMYGHLKIGEMKTQKTEK